MSNVKEPGSKYFRHFALKKVSANAIANCIFDFLSANYKEKNNIIAIGCIALLLTQEQKEVP